MKYQRILSAAFGLLILAVLFFGCTKPGPAGLKIALSKGVPDSSYASYHAWMKSIDPTAVCLDMYATTVDSALELFRDCDGLILTGGTDFDPALYGKAYDTARCWPIDHHRDELEIRLIDSAIAWGKPVLGLCRGEQAINVALGGSLIVDIPQDKGTTVLHQCTDYANCFHEIRLGSGTRLAAITGRREGTVNSNHHQAVDVLAQGLKIAAYTSDGIPESVEWADTARKPFLLGVQWHPERMVAGNPLSTAIGRKFTEECRSKVH